MIYTGMTKKAMRIAFDAHKEQVDKTGLPYIYHPIHLAEQMETDEETCVALLHDVVEDSDMTFDTLREHGFSSEIINALSLLTHDENVDYFDYVKAISKNLLATKVKLADLHHNNDITRLDNIDEKAKLRLKKYDQAIRLLSDQKNLET